MEQKLRYIHRFITKRSEGQHYDATSGHPSRVRVSGPVCPKLEAPSCVNPSLKKKYGSHVVTIHFSRDTTTLAQPVTVPVQGSWTPRGIKRFEFGVATSLNCFTRWWPLKVKRLFFASGRPAATTRPCITVCIVPKMQVLSTPLFEHYRLPRSHLSRIPAVPVGGAKFISFLGILLLIYDAFYTSDGLI